MQQRLCERLIAACCMVPALAWADNPAYYQFEGDHLAQGRSLWLENCEGCHGYGIAGAPIPTAPHDWAPRIRQPIDTLYTHAIEGFFGSDDTMMPPRGGNASLSDDQVKAAVDYMVTLARHHIKNEEK